MKKPKKKMTKKEWKIIEENLMHFLETPNPYPIRISPIDAEILFRHCTCFEERDQIKGSILVGLKKAVDNVHQVRYYKARYQEVSDQYWALQRKLQELANE